MILNELIAKTEGEDRSVPPGMRAHLAYLHYLDGDSGETIVLFREEIARFPESATFYEGMLERLGAPVEDPVPVPVPEPAAEDSEETP